MFKEIAWTLFIEAQSKPEAEKVLERFEKAIGSGVECSEFAPYWKDESLFRVVGVSSLGAQDVAVALFETLQICYQVCVRWVLTPPQEHEGNKWEFHGSEHAQTGTRIPGLKLVSFHVDNFD